MDSVRGRRHGRIRSRWPAASYDRIASKMQKKKKQKLKQGLQRYGDERE